MLRLPECFLIGLASAFCLLAHALFFLNSLFELLIVLFIHTIDCSHDYLTTTEQVVPKSWRFRIGGSSWNRSQKQEKHNVSSSQNLFSWSRKIGQKTFFLKGLPLSTGRDRHPATSWRIWTDGPCKDPTTSLYCITPHLVQSHFVKLLLS